MPLLWLVFEMLSFTGLLLLKDLPALGGIDLCFDF